MTLTVLIPAAGRGQRVVDYTQGFPKPLTTYCGLPILSHLIRQYPEGQLLIGVGHQASLIAEVLEIFHEGDLNSGRLRLFETTSHEDGRGLRGTLLDAGEHVMGGQLVFHAVDTMCPSWTEAEAKSLLAGDSPTALVARSSTSGEYRTVTAFRKVGQREIVSTGTPVYIGISLFPSAEEFFERLQRLPSGTESEVLQELDATAKDLPRGPWIDLGNAEVTNKLLGHEGHDVNVLPKWGELLWLDPKVSGLVVKGNLDEDFIRQRVRRAENELAGFVPPIMKESKHFYAYEFSPGNTFASRLDSNSADLESFQNFLEGFWRSGKRENKPNQQWKDFYERKTYRRVQGQLRGQSEVSRVINGLNCPSVQTLLGEVDWRRLAHIIPATVHGDLHPENILTDGHSYTLLDWRQGFDGADDHDLKYDLFKLLHGCFLRHESIAADKYSVKSTWGRYEISIERPPQYNELAQKVQDIGLELDVPVEELILGTGLIFLNIAPLHNPPEYSNWLFLLGHMLLATSLREDIEPSKMLETLLRTTES